jgi:hypothetical protein
LERKIQEYEYEHQCSQTITDDLKYGVLVTGQLAKQHLMRTSWRLCTWGEARHELWGDRGWVGKMCCKAPGGKYMENQFRKVEEWKGFVLNFWRMPFQPNARSSFFQLRIEDPVIFSGHEDGCNTADG